jgi:hypothetical protein
MARDTPIDPAVIPPTITVTTVEDPHPVDNSTSNAVSAPQSFVNPNDGTFLHSFAIDIDHEFDEGVRYAPRAGAKGAAQAAVWRAHSGICIRVVTWAASAIGGRPRVPYPSELCENDVLVGKKISTTSNGHTLAGEPTVSIAGCYRYVLRQAPGDGDYLMACTNPKVNVPPANNYVAITSFDRNLLASVNPAAFSGV